MASAHRPLSPHLQIYKPQLTSVLSIVHRLTGMFLSLGIVVLVYWLYSLSAGAESFAACVAVLSSIVGRTFLLLWTFSLFYHIANGIRHLVWDAGYGFELETVYRGGQWVLDATVALTFITWIIGYSLSGGSGS